jgi:hypothetical protein
VGSRTLRILMAASIAVVLSVATAASAGAARELTLAPTAGDLGSVNLGDNSGPQFLKLSISCAPPPCSETFTAAPSTGSSEFPVLNLCETPITFNDFGFFINPSCYIVVSFAPIAEGPRSAILSTGAGGPTATLTGTGVGDAAPTRPRCKKGKKGKKGASAARKCKKGKGR